ncbi:hypothetical protein D3C72_2128390 [compost metagenome]
MLGAQHHQPCLVGVGHDAAQRIVQIGNDDQRLDPLGALQQKLQGRQVDSRVGRGWDFHHPQVQAFENLQQAVEGRRLHRDGIAGLRDGAQGEVDRFGRAVGDHDSLGDQMSLGGQRTPRQDVAQRAIATR